MDCTKKSRSMASTKQLAKFHDTLLQSSVIWTKFDATDLEIPINT